MAGESEELVGISAGTGVQLEELGHFFGAVDNAAEHLFDVVRVKPEPLLAALEESLKGGGGVFVGQCVVGVVAEADGADDFGAVLGGGGRTLVILDWDDKLKRELPPLAEHGPDVGMLNLE
jgi:hypothetical protein